MHEQLDHGIFCLETGYQRPGTACCYLLVDHGEAAFIERKAEWSPELGRGTLAILESFRPPG